MKIAVCDDEKVIREDIIRLIKKQIPDADITAFESSMEMTESGEEFDISFLDIEMGKISGIDIAKHIREVQERQGRPKSIIIFVTGYKEYMEAAFDVNAYHYLLKPVNEEKFTVILRRAWKEISAAKEQEEKYIMIKSSGIQRKIFLKEIHYIESSNKKVIIHTKNGISEGYGKMEDFEKLLGSSFYRCHRCYLVNMGSISAYSADMIQVMNGDKLLLAQRKYPEFVKKYMHYARNGGIVNV